MNRAFYKSTIWSHIDSIDRAHLILIAEGVKNGCHTSFISSPEILREIESNLDIFSCDARGGSFEGNSILLPTKVYTFAKTEKELKRYLLKVNSQNAEGLFLGYPKCCVKEYCNPTIQKHFNSFILSKLKRPYNFFLEGILEVMRGNTINPLFQYLMPAQTPCSIHCKKTLKLMGVYKEVLSKYDTGAKEALEEYNQRNNIGKIGEYALLFKQKGISPEQFVKGFIFEK